MPQYDYDTISPEDLKKLLQKNKRAGHLAALATLAIPAAIGAVAAKDHAGKGAAGGILGGTVGGFAGAAAGGVGGAALAGIPTALIAKNPEAALIAAALGGGVGAFTGAGAGKLYGAYKGGKHFGTNKEKTKKASETNVEDVVFSSFQDEVLKIAAHCTPAHRAVNAAAALKKKKKTPKGLRKVANIGKVKANIAAGMSMKAAVKKAYPNYTDAQCQALVAKLKRMGMGKEAAVKIQPVPGPRRIRMPGKAALMGGAAGLAAGVPIGAVLGYKREQKRLSPQERAVVEQAMRQAYRQGNMAMYNRLKRQVKAQSQKQAAK